MRLLLNDGSILELPDSDEFLLARHHKLHHAKSRLMERFGILLTDELALELSTRCESYDPFPVYMGDSGKTFHLITLQGQEMYVVYDWEYHTIVTFYFKHWLEKLDGKWVITRLPRKAKYRRKEERYKTKYASMYRSDL